MKIKQEKINIKGVYENVEEYYQDTGLVFSRYDKYKSEKIIPFKTLKRKIGKNVTDNVGQIINITEKKKTYLQKIKYNFNNECPLVSIIRNRYILFFCEEHKLIDLKKEILYTFYNMDWANYNESLKITLHIIKNTSENENKNFKQVIRWFSIFNFELNELSNKDKSFLNIKNSILLKKNKNFP